MNNKNFLDKMKVISEPTRLTILRLLAAKGAMCACKILEDLHISQGTLSHHMKVLVKANLVRSEKNGKWCNYSLVKDQICEVAKFIQDICRADDSKPCSCK